MSPKTHKIISERTDERSTIGNFFHVIRCTIHYINYIDNKKTKALQCFIYIKLYRMKYFEKK